MYYAVLREREEVLKEVGTWPMSASYDASELVAQIFGEPGAQREIRSVEMRGDEWLVWLIQSGVSFKAAWFDYYVAGTCTKFPTLDCALDDMARTSAGSPMPDMTRAKYLIDKFCEEYYHEPGDYSDLSHVGLCYTTLETDSVTPVEVYANLVDFCIDRVLAGYLVERRKYTTLAKLVDAEFLEIDIDHEVVFTDEQIAEVRRKQACGG